MQEGRCNVESPRMTVADMRLHGGVNTTKVWGREVREAYFVSSW